MDRSIWQESISKTYCPAWPCPVCQKSALALVKDSLLREETVESRKCHDHVDWDPEYIEYAFTAWAECTHPKCKQKFAIAGRGGVGPDIGESGEYEWDEFFVPHVCYPMPEMIKLPSKCPNEVTRELQSAFALFWAYPAACAGRIRVALECLMDHLGVPVQSKNKKGKPFDLKLHARIDSFAKSHPTAGNQLMALKWLGNTGSHATTVSKHDLLDAFEIMEHALDEIIGDRSAQVAAMAKKLTKKHST